MAIEKSNSKLSYNVLNMKFMKKSKEKCERDAEEEKRKIFFESEMPDALIKGGDVCIMEPSYVPCMKLISGRLSFKGMNPEIEKLMEEEGLKDVEKLKKMDGVSDKEMAERYSTLVDTMKNKFTPKRKRAATNENGDDDVVIEEMHSAERRPKFRKPRDN